MTTRWPEARAPRGMVATPHLLATQSGLAALRAGGNALDAAIAAAATIAVVYPHMNGLGGDNVWLIYDARQQRLRALCAVGRAARAAGIDWYAARGITGAIPSRGGPAALTVPARWTAGGRRTSTAAGRWVRRSAGRRCWPTRSCTRARASRPPTASGSPRRASRISSPSARPRRFAARSGRSTTRTLCAGGRWCSAIWPARSRRCATGAPRASTRATSPGAS